jgi:hypothetical protein
MEATSSSNANKKSMSMGQAHLMTPESPLLDSFDAITAAVLPKVQPSVPSPPASPAASPFTRHYDQQLYPDNIDQSAESSLPPLFEDNRQHGWASRHQTPPTERSLSIATPPPQHDSPLQDTVDVARPKTTQKSKSTATGPVALYNTYGNEYYQLMLSQMEGHRERMMNNRTLPTPSPAPAHADRDVYDRSVLRSLGRSRVEKPRVASRPVPKTRPAKSTSTRTASTRVIVPAVETSSNIPSATVTRETPVRRIRKRTDTPDEEGNSGASKRTRAAPSKKLDGKAPSQWAELEDFCPPVSSLDSMEEELSVLWTNSSALNLDNDPDRVHLHPQELKIASKLRLHGNEYLLNKRRIFAAKLKSLQEGTAFNKTSAQNATSVDVNKASRLWSAFDGVGWFDEAWFKQWL